MKHQYVGDINDYRKYAVLRSLSGNGANQIGVCWMLTSSDGSGDGNQLGYLGQPERYCRFDPELFDLLARAAAQPDSRRLRTIEDSGAIPNATYYNELLPDAAAGRQSFMDRCLAQFRSADLVFFDPDNGLEVSLSKGRRGSSKYLYLDEVAAFYASTKSLLIYQHFPRIERTTFVSQRIEQLRAVAPASAAWTFTTSFVVFFLLIHPESPARVALAATDACSRLNQDFVRGEYLGFRRDRADN